MSFLLPFAPYMLGASVVLLIAYLIRRGAKSETEAKIERKISENARKAKKARERLNIDSDLVDGLYERYKRD
jgi:hypothetical protein